MCMEILKDCKDRWGFYEQNARKLQREKGIFINIGRNNVIADQEILTACNEFRLRFSYVMYFVLSCCVFQSCVRVESCCV